MRKIFFLKFILTGLLNNLIAQSPNKDLSEPEVGKPCPNFVFEKIDFYKSNKVSLQDLKGKWVVLDFWSRFCSGCIGSFPRISKEQTSFGDSLQFIMVSRDSTTGERALYTNYQQRLKLSMPSAFDSDIFHRFNVGLLPHIIVIDPAGIVRAITNAAHADKLSELMNGKQPTFRTATYANGKHLIGIPKYDNQMPFLVAGNGGNDRNFLFRSLLTQWEPGTSTQGNVEVGSIKPFRASERYDITSCKFELLGRGLQQLYLAAYSGKTGIYPSDTILYGKFYPTPIFEIGDTSAVQTDYQTGQNVYCYSLSVPAIKASKNYMMQVMQNDLKEYFGYEVNIETRKMPYWRLTATNEAKVKLRSKGEGNCIDYGKPAQESRLRNCPMSKLMGMIGTYSRLGGIFLDETGITTNVDIDLDWVRTDFGLVRKALQNNGLDLVPGEKEMKCIIITDSKQGKSY